MIKINLFNMVHGNKSSIIFYIIQLGRCSLRRIEHSKKNLLRKFINGEQSSFKDCKLKAVKLQFKTSIQNNNKNNSNNFYKLNNFLNLLLDHLLPNTPIHNKNLNNNNKDQYQHYFNNSNSFSNLNSNRKNFLRPKTLDLHQ